MSDEVVRPEDLRPLKKPLIEAVINAYMLKYKDGTGGLTGDHGSCEEGEFRFKVPVDWDYDPKFYVSYPDGHWKEDITWSPDDDAKVGDQVRDYDIHLFDAKAVYAEIEERVSGWIDPFIDSCPDPNSFSNQITSVANIISQLYVQDEVRVGGADVQPAGGEAGTTTTSPVSDIRDAITDIGTLLDDLGGNAIDALQAAYANDIGLTLSGQRALATVAGLAIAGEAIAWNNTYKDLKKFFAQATADFNSYAQSHGSSGEGTQQALTAVAGVATIGAGATVAFPPFAGALTVVAGVASLGAAFFPTEEARPATIIALKGSDYPSLFESFEQAVRDVDLELTHAEQSLATMCANALNDYADNPGSYSLTQHNRDGSPQPNEDLGLFLDAQIDISPRKMLGVAGRVEAIGEHQRALAGILGGTDLAGSPSAEVDFEWHRGALWGVYLGSGYYGPYDSYAAVVDALVDLLLMESRTAHRIAEHCVDIAKDFKATDEEIEQQLDLEAAMVDTVPVQRV